MQIVHRISFEANEDIHKRFNDAGIDITLGSNLLQVKESDAAWADRLGGDSRVIFSGRWGDKEFDFYTDLYIGETKGANQTLGSDWRNQAKAVFDAAKELNRTPYFHFEGPPHPDILRKLEEYRVRFGIDPVIDISPI